MLINDLNKFDTVRATVECACKNGGLYLKIDGLEGNPIVKSYNCFVKAQEHVLASIQKIDAENNYIRVGIDSVLYADAYAA